MRLQKKPWLKPAQIALSAFHFVLFAACVAILALLGGCSFPSEGEGLVGCEGCYRPPRDPGHNIGNHLMPGEESGASSSSGVAEDSSDATDSISESSSTTDDGGSSSTGDTWDDLHCDAACDGLDQMQDAEVGACVCAPECTTDEQCPVAPTHCYYGRCVIDECSAPSDCPAPGMVCGAWSIWSICMWEGEP